MEKLEHDCLKSRREYRATLEEPYHFVDSGLTTVYLVGIPYFRCSCGSEVAEIPAIKQLMSLIARDLVQKEEALTGEEIRFLRKRLGEKAADFAKHVGIGAEHLSKLENGHLSAGESTDKLVRLYFAIESKDRELMRQLTGAIAKLLAAWVDSKQPRKIIATAKDNDWELEPQAA